MAEETKVRQHVLVSQLQWIAWECDCCYREKVGQNYTTVADSTKKRLYKKNQKKNLLTPFTDRSFYIVNTANASSHITSRAVTNQQRKAL